MNCFFCTLKIRAINDDYRLITCGRTGHVEMTRTNYMCLHCTNLRFAIEIPAQELYSFDIHIGNEYTIKGWREEDKIEIVDHQNYNKKVTIPWVPRMKFDNIIVWLEELSQKYEMYLTFS